MFYGLHFFPNFNPFTQETKQKSFNLLSSVTDMSISRQISDATIAKNSFLTLSFVCVCVCVCVCVRAQSLSHVWLFETPWTVANQAPLSMEFSRQEHWSRLPFPTPEDLPDPEIEPMSLRLLHWSPGKPLSFLFRSELEIYFCYPIDSMPAESQ